MRTIREMLEAAASVRVLVAGSERDARMLDGVEQDVIARALPRPVPPMIDDPDRGSLAPKVPDLDDAEYKALQAGWWFDYRVATAAVALGSEQLGTSARWPTITSRNHAEKSIREQVEAFLAEAVPLVARLPVNEVRDVHDVAMTGSKAGDGNEAAAAKN